MDPYGCSSDGVMVATQSNSYSKSTCHLPRSSELFPFNINDAICTTLIPIRIETTLQPIFAEPLFSKFEYRSPTSDSIEVVQCNENAVKCSTKTINLSSIYADPLFLGIKFGSPASKDYMMIKPIFEHSLSRPKFRKIPFHRSISNMQCHVCDKYSSGKGGRSVGAKAVTTDDKVIVVDSETNVRSNCNIYDDTVLPDELISYSHCMRLVSARRNRLRDLCNIASWRAIKLMLCKGALQSYYGLS